MAHTMVIDAIVRAAFQYKDTNPSSSLPRKMAHDRLMALANGIDPVETGKVLAERDRCVAGLSVWADITGK